MRPLVLVIAACLLSGCTFSVRLRNDDDQPLTARLIQTDPLMKDWTLDQKRIEPGETVQLGPARSAVATVLVEVIPTHSDSLEPVRRSVLPGERAFRVGIEQEGEHCSLMLRSARWSDLTP